MKGAPLRSDKYPLTTLCNITNPTIPTHRNTSVNINGNFLSRLLLGTMPWFRILFFCMNLWICIAFAHCFSEVWKWSISCHIQNAKDSPYLPPFFNSFQVKLVLSQSTSVFLITVSSAPFEGSPYKITNHLNGNKSNVIWSINWIRQLLGFKM